MNDGPRHLPKDTPRLVVGLQPVREAIRAHGRKLGAVLIERPGRGAPSERLSALGRFAKDQGIDRIDLVPRKSLDELAGNTEHQGAAAFAPDLELLAPETLLDAPAPLIVALDGIQDPQNFGAVIRSAVALGATGIVWPEHASAPLRPATFRASAGAIEHARLSRVGSLVRFLDDAIARSVQVVGLTPEGDRPLQDVDLGLPTVLVIGSEHGGLGRAVRQRATTLARLSLEGPVQSLNASVACGIALYLCRINRIKSGISGQS